MDKYMITDRLRNDLMWCALKFEHIEKRLGEICLSESPRDMLDGMQALIGEVSCTKNTLRDYYCRKEAC